MSESRKNDATVNESDGLKKEYGVMVLTAYGDAAKLTRQSSLDGPV